VDPTQRRIIFTVTNDLNHDQRMKRICSALQEAGYDVLLIGRSKAKSAPLHTALFTQKRLTCFFESGKLFYLEYNLRLFFFLLITPCQIIGAVDLDTLTACTFAAKIRSSKLVFDAHEYFTEVPEVANRTSIKKTWSVVAKSMIPHAKLAYTVSNSLAEIFSKAYLIPFHVIRNVPDAVAVNVSDKEDYILYQGDLNEGRGLEEMIDALAALNKKLIIAGDGPLHEQLLQRAAKNKCTHLVQFIGYVNKDELAKLTAKAWLGINLLHAESLSYYYSLSNKFFNYMHAGTPQLCAPFPEYENILQHYKIGLICNCCSEDIIAAIKQLEANPNMYTQMQQACAAAAQQFTWKNEKEKLLTLYKSIA
jgi:glycosyltransferase involved in cell wall biosynthesis